ncbi:MAG: Asp-tRNA(Asn)/Glu-tRNA(Gln) amidotransferase subunit GatC [Janthinobacterium lividum]
MSLDPATVRRIARLARIAIDDAEASRLQVELSSIMGWVEQLSALDVEGVEPISGTELTALRMRADVVTDGDRPEMVLSNAPDRAGAFFSVPKVVE